MRDYKTNEQLLKDMEEMRRRQEQLESCGHELQILRKRYDTLLEATPDAMIFVNRESRIVYVNARLENLFGYHEGELAGKDLSILVPERFRARHRQNVSDYFSSPHGRPMGTGLEIYGLRKDGTEFPADISLSYIETDGEALAIAAIRDITERKLAERRIEQNYHIQRVISSALKISLEPISLDEQLNHILELILTIPGLALQKGCIFLVENEMLVLKARHGYPDLQLGPCGSVSFGKCLCGRAASSRSILFADSVDERHEIHFPSEFPHGHYCAPIVSGEKVLGLINVLVKEGHKRAPEEEEFLAAIASTLAGIIERHQTETETHRLMGQLAESEKLSALGRITANVAHEIRNPLTAIGGFTRRLHKKMADGTKEKEYSGLVISEVLRLESILRNVLSVSRVVTPHMEECSINEILERALKIYEEVCTEQSIIIKRSLGDIPLINGDKEEVLEAIENLLANAIDAMLGGGILTVTTERELVKGTHYVAVKVIDTGKGIEEEDLSKIFEPFFTTKTGLKGAGLGLSITKKIVEEHGGFVRVESKVGEGSTFCLYFPYKPET
jgi:PAS domain S-box-containing protein